MRECVCTYPPDHLININYHTDNSSLKLNCGVHVSVEECKGVDLNGTMELILSRFLVEAHFLTSAC